jgi:hypothetical protein
MDSRRIGSHPAPPWLVAGVLAMSIAAGIDEHPHPREPSSASPTPCVVPSLSTDRELDAQCHALRGRADDDECRETMVRRRHTACVIERARRHPVIVDDWGECERALREREQLERELALLTCRRSGG